MKKINSFLFNFKTAYIYTFIAGIWVSLSASLFATVVLSTALPTCTCKLYSIIILLFLGSIGAFGISAVLEAARSEWELTGFNPDPNLIRDSYIGSRIRIKFLWSFFIVCVITPIIAFILLLNK
jgi:hypothetical protein